MMETAMNAQKRATVEWRLSEVNAAIDAIPKGIPRPDILDRWRKLLDEKEQLEGTLAGAQPVDGPRFEELHDDAAKV
jgi:hypothetical protein